MSPARAPDIGGLRPPIPAVAWFAAAMWGGCVLGEHLATAGRFAILVAIVLLLFGVAAFAFRQRHTLLVIGCVGLMCGAGLSGAQAVALAQQMDLTGECGAREWQGVVEADSMPGAFGAVVRVRIRGGPLDGARVRVRWPEGEPVPELGRRVRFSAILKPLPLSEPWARRAARAGTCATASAWKASTLGWASGWSGPLYSWRERTLERMHSLRGAGGDLAEGIVMGDRRRLSGTATEQDFQVLGLTHLVAVSGSHLALACAAVAFVGAAMRLPRRALIVATVLAGLVYAVVTGLPYSALRSLLMLGVAGFGQIIGRRGEGLASLGVAVVAVLAVEPWSAFDIGLQLSVLAVGSLLLFGGLASEWFGMGAPRPVRVLVAPLALTLVAQAATVPVVASAFGIVSVLAPVANALVGALVSLALLLGLTAAVLWSAVPMIGSFLMRAAVGVLNATAWSAEVMAALPGAAVSARGGPVLALAVAAGATATWVWWPRPTNASSSRRFIAVVAACSLGLALGPAAPHSTEVTILDIGQGDAILVRDRGRTMLIDSGPNALALRQALARAGVRRIDVLVLTHAHKDHTGGNEGLASIAEVGWIGIPEARAAPGKDPLAGFNLPNFGVPFKRLAAGDTWRLGSIEVDVMWPPRETKEELSTNNTSLVIALRRGSFDMVLTGDAEGEAQEGMSAVGSLRDVDVLKVPHHGSSNGLTAQGLEAWRPELALISVGKGNDYGHPNVALLELLRGAGVTIYRTDQSGDIELQVSERGYRIVRGRGRSSAVRARMAEVHMSATPPSVISPAARTRGCVGTQDRCAQTRLPDIRRRGAAARSRAPPVA